MSLFVVPPEAQSGGYRHKVCPTVDNVEVQIANKRRKAWMLWQMKALH